MPKILYLFCIMYSVLHCCNKYLRWWNCREKRFILAHSFESFQSIINWPCHFWTSNEAPIWVYGGAKQVPHHKPGKERGREIRVPPSIKTTPQWPPDILYLLKPPSPSMAALWIKLLTHEPFEDIEQSSYRRPSSFHIPSLVMLQSSQSRLYWKEWVTLSEMFTSFWRERGQIKGSHRMDKTPIRNCLIPCEKPIKDRHLSKCCVRRTDVAFWA